jgi:hypothetical protein
LAQVIELQAPDYQDRGPEFKLWIPTPPSPRKNKKKRQKSDEAVVGLWSLNTEGTDGLSLKPHFGSSEGWRMW